MSARSAPAGRGAAPAAAEWPNGATGRLRCWRVHREVVRMRRGGAPEEVDEAIFDEKRCTICTPSSPERPILGRKMAV